MKEKIGKYVAGLFCEVSEAEANIMIEIPPDEQMGDYAVPCFALAKKQHKNPMLIAAELREALMQEKEMLGIETVECVGGYCNIYMNRIRYAEGCLAKLMEPRLGVEAVGEGKTICMDYSSPNIAKNFHVGHLRTTIIGNSLYKIYDKLGYRVIRINHLGDWGTQFGKLIVAYKNWSSREEVEKKGIEELLRIYIKFNSEMEERPELMEEARSWFVKMEQNDPEAIEIWKWFKKISMVEFERVYELLGVSFDSCIGESFYRDKVPALLEELTEKKLLEESQGAKIISLEEYGMPPCLITKSDGGSIYHSRDIAAILYRKRTYNFDKCLYVTGMEQSLHFKQIFKAIELMGYDWAGGLVHVPYGLVSLEGAKLSTRTGNIIYAEDILKEAVTRAMTSIQVKNPDLKDKENTARKVGVGAVIFHDLFNQRIKNVDFVWDKVLNFDGTTGPYVQYTYARAKSILRKLGCAHASDAKGYSFPEDDEAYVIDYSVLTDNVTYALIKKLSEYENAVKEAAECFEPSVIARYLVGVAAAFNKFYHECPILHGDDKQRAARLLLVDLAQRVIKDACGLLGMECPEEM